MNIKIAAPKIKIAAPKGVKDKALWDKIEKNVMDYGKYKGDQIYKVVQDAYQRAGGTYTHKSEASALGRMLEVAKKISNKLSKIASFAITTQDDHIIGVDRVEGGILLTIDGDVSVSLSRNEAAKLSKALSEHTLSILDQELEEEAPETQRAKSVRRIGDMDEIGNFKLELLPNGFVRVEDRMSGLTGLFYPDGKVRHSSFGKSEPEAQDAVRQFMAP